MLLAEPRQLPRPSRDRFAVVRRIPGSSGCEALCLKADLPPRTLTRLARKSGEAQLFRAFWLRCRSARPFWRSKERRAVLPSSATTPWTRSDRAAR